MGISIEMKIWLNKEVVEMVLRHEEKAKRCEQCLEETKAGTWSRVFGRIKLFRGSGHESDVSELNPMAAAAETRQLNSMRNYALEVELTKARALAHWDSLRRNMI